MKEQSKIPTHILRRLRLSDLSDDMKKNSLRLIELGEPLDTTISKGAKFTTDDKIPYHDQEGNDYDENDLNEWGEIFKKYLIDNYGTQTKEYISKTIQNKDFNNDGNKYVFWKHSEINGGNGFSESHETWGELILGRGWWFPLNWWEIKSELDKMDEGKKLILRPGDKHNTMGYYFSIIKVNTNMRESIKKVLKEQYDNIQKSNLNKLLEKFKTNFPEELRPKIDIIEKFVVDYIQDHNFTVKFLNSCSTGFKGVRTKDQIIICTPDDIDTLGDLIYTIFHEIRHEEQLDKNRLGLDNPLTEYDLEDFENLFKKYWELEMDADNFGKKMISKLVVKLGIPIDVAKEQFKLSPYIQNYPLMSNMVMSSLKQIVNSIKDIKKSGGKYTDIQDHPIVKRHLNKLENLI
jgi:hypothetical protein